jgi:hypothetical protein
VISKESFMKLKRGDVVLFGKRKTPRLVEIGPANYDPPNRTVVFAILKRSWTDRILTAYNYNDLKRTISLPRSERNKAELRRHALERLTDLGWNVQKEIARELKEFKRTRKWQEDWGVSKFKCSIGYTYKQLEAADE